MSRLLHHEIERYIGGGEIKADNVEDYVQRLVLLFKYIDFYGEKVKKTYELYDAEIFPGVSICDFIYAEGQKYLSRDSLFSFKLMIDQSPILSQRDFDEALIVGTLGLIVRAEKNAISVVEEWLNFVREDLSSNDKSCEEFYSDFAAAFPNLVFSSAFPECLKTFSGGHELFSRLIVSCLTSLNNNWEGSGGDLPNLLREFSVKSSCETTLEGDGRRKPDFTFTFAVNKEKNISILCEPHMKLTSSDRVGDGEFYYHRIYFCPRHHEDFKGKVLVGHAGKHL